MDFTGIIAEYDPFHNGHAAQLAAVRAAGAQCIAVCMSSGTVQRGGALRQSRRGRPFAGRRKARNRRSGPAADAGPREFCAGARRA